MVSSLELMTMFVIQLTQMPHNLGIVVRFVSNSKIFKLEMGMKKFVLAGAALALSGCMAGPSTTDDVRSMTSGNKLFGKQTVVNIPRSHAAVTASLRQGATKCMNRSVRNVSTTPGRYGPQTSVYIIDYSSSVKSSNGRTELAMYQEVRGGFLPQPKGISYVVDATAMNGGTKMVIHSGRFGSKNMNAAVEQWARGGAIVCPKLPGSI